MKTGILAFIAAIGTGNSYGPITFSKLGQTCLSECTCKRVNEGNVFADCSTRNLELFPKFSLDLKPRITRLNLRHNNITGIYREDLVGYDNLKILDLSRNNIVHLDQNAFEKVPRLQKILLKENDLSSMPSSIFKLNTQLRQIDLSSNSLSIVSRRHFRNTRRLRTLYLQKNRIKCITDRAFDRLKRLETLNLEGNKFVNFPNRLFDKNNMLKLLRLDGNLFVCDCQIKYLALFLKRKENAGHKDIAPFTKCTAGRANFLITKIISGRINDLHCSQGQFYQSSRQQCREESICPSQCSCEFSTDGTEDDEILDCRDCNLETVPPEISKTVQTIRLEDNNIKYIKNRQFSPYHRLRHLDLSNNKIDRIDKDAFYGLHHLKRILLYENRIKTIEVGTFAKLSSLEIIFLNSNHIRCIQRDLLMDLTRLHIMSLYDNQLETLPKGLFQNNKELQVIHLGHNEWNCDCKLKWLIELFDDFKQRYQKKNDETGIVVMEKELEGSGAECSRISSRFVTNKIKDSNHKILLSSLSPSQLKCQRGDHYDSVCEDSCPVDCKCDPKTFVVTCRTSGMVKMPDSFPRYMTKLDVSHSGLKELPGWLSKYSITELDLSETAIILKADMFASLPGLRVLTLDANDISGIPRYTFTGLYELKKLSLRNNNIRCLSNETFYPFDLKELTELDLYNNKLAEIGDATLSSLPNLQQLNILNNELVCDCLLKSTHEYLKRSAVQVARAKCLKPPHLFNFAILDLDNNDFKCEEPKTAVSCAMGDTCPRGCTCSPGRVVCASLGLKMIPTDIPKTTHWLGLQGNKIENLAPIIHLKELEHLDLSGNMIPGIASNAFNLPKLKRLYLSNNKIKCISEDAFRGLPKLEILALNDNQIRRFSIETFPEMSYKSINIISISGNPLQCDCALTWLILWIKSSFAETGEAKCAQPNNLNYVPLLHADENKINQYCPKESDIWDDCDACEGAPCSNGGQCQNTDNFSYECACPKGFKGDRCEINAVSDPCLSSPCVNGICRLADDAKKYWCDCLSGFTGNKCDIKIDQCEKNPCPADAVMCVDSVTEPHCICPAGKLASENNCDVEDLCFSHKPCQNDGTCIPYASDYKCECPLGWRGKTCTIQVNHCEDGENPCQNGGECFLTPDRLDFGCNCKSKYSGKHCELYNEIPFDIFHHDGLETLPSDESTGKKCTNGGWFDKIMQKCRCSDEFTGMNCEKVLKISLNAQRSYAVVNAENAIRYRTINITLEFRTASKTGVLFYATAKDEKRPNVYLAIELLNGFLRVRHAGSTIYSKEPLGADQPHVISIIIGYHNLFKLHIDKEEFRPKETRTLTDDIQKIVRVAYIGGVSSEIADYAKGKGDIQTTDSIIGCIGMIKTNDQPRYFNAESGFSGRVSLGCFRDVECFDGKHCQNGGRCSQNVTGVRVCTCKDGWTGDECGARISEFVTNLPSVSVCNKNICGPNGECFVIDNISTCKCHKGWSGKYCRERVTGQCDPHDKKCVRGRCKINRDGKPYCHCFAGASGDRCQISKKPCRLRRFIGSYTHQDATATCIVSSIPRDFCEGRYLRGSSNRRSCGSSHLCQPVQHLENKLLTCDDGSTRVFPVSFTTSCNCEQVRKPSYPFI